MSTRSNYLVNGSTIDEVINALNIHLSSIADRLDKIEAIRGTPSFSAEGVTAEDVIVNDADGEKIHSLE